MANRVVETFTKVNLASQRVRTKLRVESVLTTIVAQHSTLAECHIAAPYRELYDIQCEPVI